MKTYFFPLLLQNQNWIENTRVSINGNGVITEISTGKSHPSDEVIPGFGLPGFQNAHSHAFQYAMAGLAEIHKPGSSGDDFWSWREAMYQLALSVTPDQMEAIATMLYAEMVRHGYTHVAEFHYVHHQPDGTPYKNLAEMGSRLIAAAKAAGINITLIPIFYQKGGFGTPPNDRQKRFISATVEDYFKLLEASIEAAKAYDGANVGIGIHSMRGVEPKDIVRVAKEGPQDLPFHIHISEQLKEVSGSMAYLGKRPVEWLLDNIAINERFHLVHATHLTEEETKGIAKSGANVVICPSTEGNLGDGIFPLRAYQAHGGNWSIGTDSHVGLNPMEELRILDYGQRLISHQRDTFTDKVQGDSGLYALNQITHAGRRAMGNHTKPFFEVGQKLNASIFDEESPLIAPTAKEKLTTTLVYSTDASQQWGTIVNGKLVVQEGKHVDNAGILRNFKKAMGELKNRA